jgi:hypothetical protein
LALRCLETRKNLHYTVSRSRHATTPDTHATTPDATTPHLPAHTLVLHTYEHTASSCIAELGADRLLLESLCGCSCNTRVLAAYVRGALVATIYMLRRHIHAPSPAISCVSIK